MGATTKTSRIAIYPGSFDPISLGHLDIVKRGAAIFDRLILGIASSPPKNPMFTAEERAEMARLCTEEWPNVEVRIFDGLLVDYMRKEGIGIILRGIRTVTDFEYEFQMAVANKRLAPEIETFFMMTEEIYSYLSSTIIKEIARLGGDVSTMVPDIIKTRIMNKLSGS